MIEVGDDNHMLFQEVSDVTFWITSKERVVTKLSQYDELQLKYNTKSDILVNLKIYGLDISVVKGKGQSIFMVLTIKM